MSRGVSPVLPNNTLHPTRASVPLINIRWRSRLNAGVMRCNPMLLFVIGDEAMKIARTFFLSLSLILICLSNATAEPRKIDSFGAINCEDEMARLDNFALEIQNSPEAQAYISVYGGRRDTRRNEVRARLSRIRYYLLNNRMIASDRIILVNGGYRERFTVELWIRPRGEVAPVATPTVQPRDVRFKRGKVQRWEYDCSELG